MMWNKLLLTEFVIYLCCLGGLMPLVFWVLQIFLFLFFPLLFLSCLLMCTNLAVWKRQVDDQISWMSWQNNNRESTIQSLCRRYSSSQPQMLLTASLSYFKRHCRFGLTDVTGCNSAKSPLHWWIMTPWLGSSEILFESFLIRGRR